MRCGVARGELLVSFPFQRTAASTWAISSEEVTLFGLVPRIQKEVDVIIIPPRTMRTVRLIFMELSLHECLAPFYSFKKATNVSGSADSRALGFSLTTRSCMLGGGTS